MSEWLSQVSALNALLMLLSAAVVAIIARWRVDVAKEEVRQMALRECQEALEVKDRLLATLRDEETEIQGDLVEIKRRLKRAEDALHTETRERLARQQYCRLLQDYIRSHRLPVPPEDEH